MAVPSNWEVIFPLGLGEWLCDKFREFGYEVEELIPEDWGWCVMCNREQYLLWIGCGAMQADDFPDSYNPESPPDSENVVWHVFPVIEVPFYSIKSWIKNVLGKLDTEQPFKKLRGELKSILEAEQRIELCEEP